jgi:hypothetical protein
VNVAENLTVATRAATVTITSGTLSQQVTVTQAAAAPTLGVTPATIDAAAGTGTYAVTITSNTAWTAAVNTAATWCTLSPASATGNGTVTVNVAENLTVATRAATVTITSGTLSQQVTVTQAAAAPPTPPAAGTPPHAASTQTWTFGSQTWSDAIQILACDNNTFLFSNTEPHCRSYTLGQDTWYYYNWPYAMANAQELCPSPWRLPTFDEVSDLGMYTDYEELIAEWGLGGAAQYADVSYPANEAAYWTSTPYYDEETGESDSQSWHLYYTNGVRMGTINLPPAMALTVAGNNIGMQVRCVK